MDIPNNLGYSKEHEWVKTEGNIATIGITDFAQDSLGDIVFVSLPEVDKFYQKGDVLGEVESTKSVSEIYSPVSGTVRSVNSALIEHPEEINRDPYGSGWIATIELSDSDEVGNLLDATSYSQLISG